MKSNITNPLTPAQEGIIHLCRKTGFGEIRNLHIKNGQPDCSRLLIEKRERLPGAPIPARVLKPTGGNLSEPERLLLQKLGELPDGTGVRVVVRGGQPLDMISESEVTGLSR